ncbi:MAG: carboxypeptidase regulatory-like domain-containing protein [Polyangia bacterium]
MTAILPLAALPLAGCTSESLGGGSCAEGVDTDLDGLTNDVECRLGTNALEPDTDGDGVVDGDEVARGTDPKISDGTPLKIPGCTGACAVNYKCPQSFGPTTLTGTVTIPSGTLPLYNAKVYIPTGDAIEPPPPTGATCDRCDVTPQGFSTTTDINGNFTLTNVPHGQNIPLIIRVGKWRRVVTIPSVSECTTTALPASDTRLPRNKSEGNIPRIALSTGGSDALECLLRRNKLGLDDSEFTSENGTGRVNLYGGATGANTYSAALGGGTFTTAQPTPAASWWDTASNWTKYDIVMLSCEGGNTHMEVKSAAAVQNLENYINMGGRVFATHWQHGWIINAAAGRPIRNVATFASMADPGNVTAKINTGFTKGRALADWLILPNVWGPSAPPARGDLPINPAQWSVATTSQTLTQTWVNYNNVPQYFSFNAPVGASTGDQCGQMVFTDIHVSSAVNGDTSVRGTPFPTACTATSLSAQEKALIFMLFDLTNCLQPLG